MRALLSLGFLLVASSCLLSWKFFHILGFFQRPQMISNKNNFSGYYDLHFFPLWDHISWTANWWKSQLCPDNSSFNASTYTGGLDTARVLSYKMDNFYILYLSIYIGIAIIIIWTIYDFRLIFLIIALAWFNALSSILFQVYCPFNIFKIDVLLIYNVSFKCTRWFDIYI